MQNARMTNSTYSSNSDASSARESISEDDSSRVLNLSLRMMTKKSYIARMKTLSSKKNQKMSVVNTSN
jgi:hypothetical protein